MTYLLFQANEVIVTSVRRGHRQYVSYSGLFLAWQILIGLNLLVNITFLYPIPHIYLNQAKYIFSTGYDKFF